MVINLLAGTTAHRCEMAVEDTATLKTVMEDCKKKNIDVTEISHAVLINPMTQNEVYVSSSDFNKTFADFGITEKAILLFIQVIVPVDFSL